jgi:adenylate cyclase class 2
MDGPSPDDPNADSLEPTMLEVENKYRCADWDAVKSKVVEWGGVCEPTRKDTDTYFNAPNRDFAETGEAFRLRSIGSQNILTYKGPKKGEATKTRLEVELCLGQGPPAAATAVRMLTLLGYTPVAVVTKKRDVIRFRRADFDFEACFDSVGSFGRYVELEILCDPKAQTLAEAALLAVAAELGLTDREPRSYLELMMSQSKSGQFRTATVTRSV